MAISTSEIMEAIRDVAYLVYYQPKVDAMTEEIVGYEALVRLQTKKGILAPAEFFREVVHLYAARDMQHFVLSTVMKQIDELEGKYPISVNIPSGDVTNDAYMDALYEQVKKEMRYPEALNLEIVERLEITRLEAACHNLMKLKSLGVKVSLDDFGQGYSSLSYLQSLPVDYVKTDRSSISLIKTNERQRIILRAIINLSHDLGCLVVVEGVEDEKEIAILRTMNADYFQGYYFGRPQPINQRNL